MKRLFSIILLIGLILTISTGCGKQVFNGNRTGNDKQFIMEYTVLNKTQTHQMKLEKGASIDVIIENKSGRLDILIVNEEGEKLYRADDASTGKFSLEIPKTDTYSFSITGNKAKGSVSFKVAE